MSVPSAAVTRCDAGFERRFVPVRSRERTLRVFGVHGAVVAGFRGARIVIERETAALHEDARRWAPLRVTATIGCIDSTPYSVRRAASTNRAGSKKAGARSRPFRITDSAGSLVRDLSSRDLPLRLPWRPITS